MTTGLFDVLGSKTLEISRFRAACGATPLEMTRRVFSSSSKRVMPSEAEASQTGFGLSTRELFCHYSILEISRFRAACGAIPLEMTRRVFSSSSKRVMPSEAEASQTGFGVTTRETIYWLLHP